MKKGLQILCVLTMMIGLFVTTKPIHAEETTVERIYGENRYETAYEVADTLKEVLGVEKFDTVIIANGTNFADALAGSYLAAKRNAPILMASNNRKINDVTLNYIYANVNDGGTVYILGGYNALPMSLDGSLVAYNVVRLAGKDRYETNIKILQEAGITDEPLLVATGKGFADSLSASATGLPILLVDKTINEQQKDFLHTLSLENIYIIGGTSAVSNEVESEMYKLVDQPVRLAGKNRYETSVLVAKTFVQEPKQAVLAYGKNFPDGLSGGVLAYVTGSPLLLTENKQANTIATYTQEAGITSGYVLGGNGLISNNTKNSIFNDEEPGAGDKGDNTDDNASMGSQPKPETPTEELKPWSPEEVPYGRTCGTGMAFATWPEAARWADAQVEDPNSPWYGKKYQGIQVAKNGQKKLGNDPWVVRFY